MNPRPILTLAALAALSLAPLAAACGATPDPGTPTRGTGGAPDPVDAAGPSGERDSGGPSTPPLPASDAGARDASDDAAPPPRGKLVAFASGYAPDLAAFTVDPASGALGTKTDTPTPAGFSPSFLAVNPAATNLYAVSEVTPGLVAAYAIDRSTGALTFLNSVSSQGNGPAHLSVDASGKWVLVANYTDGKVAVLPVQAGGKLGDANGALSPGSNSHMIVVDPSNRFAFVPCKGSDYVAQLTFDAATGTLTPNGMPRVATAAGAGPRHLAFHPGGKLAYLINENDSTITAYRLDLATGRLSAIETQSTLPQGATGANTGADVWVHPSGKLVYGSNRGDDSIVVFAIDEATGKMTLRGHTKSGGNTPRDFTVDPSGAFLYAANQGIPGSSAGNVTEFRIDPASGTLTATGPSVGVPSATFIGIFRLPAP